jgi:hypothetical protein
MLGALPRSRQIVHVDAFGVLRIAWARSTVSGRSGPRRSSVR